MPLINPSAICTVNGTTLATSGVTGFNATSGQTITVALANPNGVNTWSIQCTATDGVNPGSAMVSINNTRVINYTNWSATFVVPTVSVNTGFALQFTSIVNQGTSNQNTFTFGVFNTGTVTSRMLFSGENFESNATYGVSYDLNNLINGANIWVSTLISDTTPFTVPSNNYALLYQVNSGTPGAVLPAAEQGRTYVIKDSGGHAASFNITITTTGGAKIDGASSYVINTNYGAVTLMGDGTNWNIISSH